MRYLLLSYLFLFPMQAFALSCAPPVMSEEAIERAALIFEGTVLSLKEKKVGSPKGPEQNSVYRVSVDKVWKGITTEEIDISYNTYWGDSLQVGGKYLVETYSNDGKHMIDLCGNTTHIMSAGDKLEILKLRFGNSRVLSVLSD